MGYDVFTVDHLAVAVELKVARPIAYPLTWTLRLAYEHNQVHMLTRSHSIKNGLETRQSQRTSVLSSIITW